MMNSAGEILNCIFIRNYSTRSSVSEIVITFYLFLTIPVTVAKAERFFSN